MAEALDFAAYKAWKEAQAGPIVWQRWDSEPVAVGDAEPLKVSVGTKGFDFDSDALIPAEEPYRDNSEMLDKVIGHIYAILTSLIGVKCILLIMDGSANAIIYKVAHWMFWPLLSLIS